MPKEIMEMGYDIEGNLLWKEPYKFKRLFTTNQEMLINGVTMTVMSCELVDNIVITIVKLYGECK